MALHFNRFSSVFELLVLIVTLHRFPSFHCYDSSTLDHCIAWPSSLYALLEVFNLLGLDIMAQARVPCIIKSFNYYKLIVGVCVTPVAISAAITVVCMLWVLWRSQSSKAKRRVSLAQDRRQKSAIADGLWTAAAPVLFFLDLVYPLVTRPVAVLQKPFPQRKRCIAQPRPGCPLLHNAPRFY